MFLPNELVDYILSFLQSDDFALEMCTRSGPILSKFVERYTYADITLFDDPHPKVTSRTTPQLTQILANKPEIAHYIRSLTIYLKDYGNSQLITIASLLPTFSQLTKITLNGNWKDSSWIKLPEAFRQAFLRAQVTYVCISSIFPFHSVRWMTLRRATLDLCGEMQYDEGSMKDRASPLIKHFAVRPCRGMNLEYITGWVQAHNLRILKFTGAPDNVEHSFRELLPPLLTACSGSLTSLCLDLKDKCQPEVHCMVTKAVQNDNGIARFPVKLTDLRHLEHLTICGVYKTDAAENAFPVLGIMELISTAPSTLKRVSLCFETDSPCHMFQPHQWPPFVPLAAQCASLSVAVRLRCVWSDGKPRDFPWMVLDHQRDVLD